MELDCARYATAVRYLPKMVVVAALSGLWPSLRLSAFCGTFRML